jgi:hypothetical protein
MPLPKDQAWFPRKRYGWGWGMPTRWQGIAVMFGFLGAMILGAVVILPRNIFAYLGYIVVISAILTSICYKKGEAPRWSDDDKT